MENQIIENIKQEMVVYLNNQQMEQLSDVLAHYLRGVTKTTVVEYKEHSAESLIISFLAAKRVEGCSGKSLRYYESTLKNAMNKLRNPVKQVTTDDLRRYLDEYYKNGNVSKVTIDNIRRILSSFFSWLEEENIIIKSPMRRIRKIKTGTTIKETYTDEALEVMRDNCDSLRDLAIIDILASTGMRVGELVKLNRSDIDFDNRECIVFGKGDKERLVYFDARTKVHLLKYLKEREDTNNALFVSIQKPYNRLEISGVEIRLRNLGRRLKMTKVHPHKFRRTLATMAIDKGMPIEQVQQLLGHQSIETTLKYAMVNQANVKNSHKKYLS